MILGSDCWASGTCGPSALPACAPPAGLVFGPSPLRRRFLPCSNVLYSSISSSTSCSCDDSSSTYPRHPELQISITSSCRAPRLTCSFGVPVERMARAPTAHLDAHFRAAGERLGVAQLPDNLDTHTHTSGGSVRCYWDGLLHPGPRQWLGSQITET